MTEEKEKNIVELEEDDAALIIGSEGIQLVLPQFDSADMVPEYFLYMSALAYLTLDREFIDETIDKFTKMIAEEGLPETDQFRE